MSSHLYLDFDFNLIYGGAHAPSGLTTVRYISTRQRKSVGQPVGSPTTVKLIRILTFASINKAHLKRALVPLLSSRIIWNYSLETEKITPLFVPAHGLRFDLGQLHRV
jgi:hypothetical protein